VAGVAGVTLAGAAGGGALARGFATGAGVGVATGAGTGVAGLPVRVIKLGLAVLGGSLTKVVVLRREGGVGDTGPMGETCLGGSGGGAWRRWEMGWTLGGTAAGVAGLGGGTAGGPVTLGAMGVAGEVAAGNC
jgi:hypothetical protein